MAYFIRSCPGQRVQFGVHGKRDCEAAKQIHRSIPPIIKLSLLSYNKTGNSYREQIYFKKILEFLNGNPHQDERPMERQAVPASIPGSSMPGGPPRPVFVIICACPDFFQIIINSKVCHAQTLRHVPTEPSKTPLRSRSSTRAIACLPSACRPPVIHKRQFASRPSLP